MRKSSLSDAEIADLDESTRRESRKSGFGLMSERDGGTKVLSNGVRVFWNHPTYKDGDDNFAYIRKAKVPDNHLGIVIDGKLIVFNGEELKRALRWV